ncbi:hypothetical protein LX15_003877 [Streptoalloteichus tenebrarius]|uniref:Secreted protein n=1 Tax=Streptoalloteichus tenebrarius (strain ATCC 17920 / DSM 40477 / JCM 4838 / CBS 697.72 / NBRC 16177 / NCIMB 11028 / NRRL B-12390 / A12253. 1 / ISP 5477) TaxID=1933 RepID=A0ABT1HXC4_STRSD|nr:hypothetical protein [Streptoalloteichus tenebrarius]MCP2260164.1 hypothetical protein [Streptoalloteichus tenebrarius]BFF02629.1 hypothetical protein GCM10020241_43040 [Streptoalloteichus tenebrarius]
MLESFFAGLLAVVAVVGVLALTVLYGTVLLAAAGAAGVVGFGWQRMRRRSW